MIFRYGFVLMLCVCGLFASEVERYKLDDIKNVDEKSAMNDWINSGFGLKAYKVNYIAPYSVRFGDEKYKSYTITDEYLNTEVEFQLSLKLKFGSNLFGLNEEYYGAYTQHAFWQLYAVSSPFRENVYNPEAFVVFPLTKNDWGIKSLKVAFAHRSNGQGSNENIEYPDDWQNRGNRSRSVNYFYTTMRLQHDTLITDINAWMPIVSSLDDNTDLMTYTGYTSVKFNYFFNKSLITLMARGNFATLKGAVELSYSYPIVKSVFFYTKLFSGYTESLIDYDTKITKLSIGFSFSR